MLPTATPPPANTPATPSERAPEQGHAHKEAEEKEDAVEGAGRSSNQEEEVEVTAFKYVSRSNVLSRSFRSPESASSHLAAYHRSSEGIPGPIVIDTSKQLPEKEGEEGEGEEVVGGLRSSRFRQTSVSEESSTCNSMTGSKTELSVGGVGGREELAKSPPMTTPVAATKSHPYSRRIELSPRTMSPTTATAASSQRTRPRILTYGKTDAEGRGTAAKASPAPLMRRSTLSSIQPGRRLLPAPPMRRGSVKLRRRGGNGGGGVTNANASGEKLVVSPSSDRVEKSSGRKDGSEDVDSFASELASSLEVARELLQENSDLESAGGVTHPGEEREGEDGGAASAAAGAGDRERLLHTTPCGSTSSVNSAASGGRELEEESRVRHTVQYNNNSALFNKGESGGGREGEEGGGGRGGEGEGGRERLRGGREEGEGGGRQGGRQAVGEREMQGCYQLSRMCLSVNAFGLNVRTLHDERRPSLLNRIILPAPNQEWAGIDH